jgi:uncharacterized protein
MNTLIEKEFDLQEPIAKVWNSLASPEEIVDCVPGAAITEKIDDRTYKGEVITKFGPIKAAYAGDIAIVELDEPNYKMVLKGRGLDSKGKGSADMVMNGTLTENGGTTHVKFTMDITIIGTLAQFGSRLINDVSDQLLNQFVVNFKEKLANIPGEAGAVATPAMPIESEGATATLTEPATAAAPKKENALDASSLFWTVLKSIFNSIIDFLKSLLGIKKTNS